MELDRRRGPLPEEPGFIGEPWIRKEPEKRGGKWRAAVKYRLVAGEPMREASAQGLTGPQAKVNAKARAALKIEEHQNLTTRARLAATGGLGPESTFAEVYAHWRKRAEAEVRRGQKAGGTLDAYATQWRNWIGPALADKAVSTITPGMMRDVLEACRDGAEATVKASKGTRVARIGGASAAKTAHSLLRVLARHAEDYHCFGSAPTPLAKDVTARERRENRKAPRALTDEEMQVMLARIEGWIHGRPAYGPRSQYLTALMMVTFEMGVRISEALGLPAGAVGPDPEDPARLVITPDGSAVKYNSFRGLHLDERNKNRRQVWNPIRLGEATSAVLREHLARLPLTSPHLFPNAVGKPLDDGNVYRALCGTPVKGGGRVGGALAWPIRPEVDLSWIGFHTLRRSRLTEVAATDFTLAMTMAGHANPATTAAYLDRTARGTLDVGGIHLPGLTR